MIYEFANGVPDIPEGPPLELISPYRLRRTCFLPYPSLLSLLQGDRRNPL